MSQNRLVGRMFGGTWRHRGRGETFWRHRLRSEAWRRILPWRRFVTTRLQRGERRSVGSLQAYQCAFNMNAVGSGLTTYHSEVWVGGRVKRLEGRSRCNSLSLICRPPGVLVAKTGPKDYLKWCWLSSVRVFLRSLYCQWLIVNPNPYVNHDWVALQRVKLRPLTPMMVGVCCSCKCLCKITVSWSMLGLWWASLYDRSTTR